MRNWHRHAPCRARWYSIGAVLLYAGCCAAPTRQVGQSLSVTISPEYRIYAKGDWISYQMTIQNNGPKTFSVAQERFGFGFRIGDREHIGEPVVFPKYAPEDPRQPKAFVISPGEAREVPGCDELPADSRLGPARFSGLFWTEGPQKGRTVFASEPVSIDIIPEWSTAIGKDAALEAAASALKENRNLAYVLPSIANWQKLLKAETFRDGWRVGFSFPTHAQYHGYAIVDGSGKVVRVEVGMIGCK